MAKSLANGKRIEVRGFGAFRLKIVQQEQLEIHDMVHQCNHQPEM